jgi:hypothetical protein
VQQGGGYPAGLSDGDWSRFVTPAKVTVEFHDGQIIEAKRASTTPRGTQTV